MSLTALTGGFSCGTLSLLGSLSKSGGVLWNFGGTVIPAPHPATNSSCWRWQRTKTRQARAREMLRAPPFSRSNEHRGLSWHDVTVRTGKPLGRCETRCWEGEEIAGRSKSRSRLSSLRWSVYCSVLNSALRPG